MSLRAYFVLIVLIFLLFKCKQAPTDSSSAEMRFELHAPETTGVNFSNLLFEDETLNIINYEYMYNGAGVAVGDINQDGLPDLYFSGNMVEGKLYLNLGDFKFKDITAQSGISTKNKWGTGVSMVDLNGDGWLDLYLCFSGPFAPDRRKNLLYINNGDLTFSEQAEQFGLDDDGPTTQAVFFDYDKDGDLDAYLLNNIISEIGPNIIRPKKNKGTHPSTDHFYRNDKGVFTNISQQAGIQKEGYGLGVALGDVNQDGWTDVYVSNDYLSNDLLYINNQDGTFTDQADQYLRHTSYSSMGCDMADYNNDALLDIIAVDMLPPDQTRRKLMLGSMNYNRYRSELKSGYLPQFMRNTLQLNQGPTLNGTTAFSEIGQLAGIQSTDWSWSPLFCDLDNDGWKDLLITNGYPRDVTNMDFASYKASLMMNGQFDDQILQQLIQAVNEIDGAYLPNYVFQNAGDLTFKDRSEEWGFTQPSFSHGAVVADLDNDGDLDYIINNSYDPVFIYENKAQSATTNHFLRLELQGISGNTSGLGSKVWVYQNDQVQYQEFFPFRGFQSTVEPILHFGLGSQAQVDSVVIQWPDDAQQVVYQPTVDQTLKVNYKTKNKQPSTAQIALAPIYSPKPTVNYRHQEPHFADFNAQPLLPHKHSQLGPSLCVGDVNQDGLDDFYVGGAFNQSGRLFLQQPNGQFLGQELEPPAVASEEVGCLFFDKDQDGDLDLYVASGSSEFPEHAPFYQDRLYQNDGKGVFTLDQAGLPNMKTSTGTVVAADFDQDGDEDLFVGGRLSPQNYPQAPKSYLLENRDGQFIDVTMEKAPNLDTYGMVTDAKWVDVDEDGWEDLVVVGEWLPISIFKNKQGFLEDITTSAGLTESIGWWNTLSTADLDQDGDMDFIVGNLGLNSPHKTSTERPFSLFLGDFDKNGKLDPILVHYLQDRQVPVHFRDDLLSWIFPLRKKFRDYKSFASADWNDFFPNQTSERLNSHTFASSWVENLGDGQFKLHALPIQAQFAPVFGLLVEDSNRDGHLDILLSGNTSGTDPQTGPYDAFNGLLLVGDGKGQFTPLRMQESGFYVPKEGRNLAKLNGVDGRQLILVAQNNDSLLIFEK